jgi:hypothetical protein
MSSPPLIAPKQVPMRTPIENDQRVTCSSCRFAYPKVRGFCPLCGTAMPVDEAAYRPGKPLPARPERNLKMISALFVLLICASLATVRRYKVPTIPTRTVTGKSLVASRQNAVAPQIPAQLNSPANRDTTSSEPRAQTLVEVEVRDDPAELWKRVQNGSANAEVELARLYLDGKGVAQNCEQAHLLLLAALKKRSNAASNLLSGDYVRRCQ